jgi:cytochrome P450
MVARLPLDGVVDLQPLFFNLTLDIATALLFGRSAAESFNIAQEGLAKRFRIAPWHFLYNPPEFRKACADVHRFVEQYIDQFELQNNEDQDDKAYSFIKQVAQESTSKEDLRDQLLNVLLAGRDTTACCLSWTLYVADGRDV